MKTSISFGRISILAVCLLFLQGLNHLLTGQTLSELESGRISLPNGWSLTPAGKVLPLGDLPLNIAVSRSGKLAAITNNGESDQSICLADLQKEIITDSVAIGKSWFGLVFSPDEKYLYASGGNDNFIIKYACINNHLYPDDTLKLGKPWPEKISVAGIDIDKKGKRLYAVTRENNSVYVIDIASKKILLKQALGGEAYTCLLSPDNLTLYISCWGCDQVILLDTRTLKISGSIKAGDNPNDLCQTGNGKYLFVANANDNNVSVIDTRNRKVIEVLNASLYPGAPPGSTTNSVALSRDEKTLFIANADNNCLTLFDVSVPGKSISKGFIPTGWYPTSVRTTNNKILVSNGKGLSSMANPYGPDPTRRGQTVTYQQGGMEHKIKIQYIGGLFRGALNIIPIPETTQLGVYSQTVINNTPYIKKNELISSVPTGNPVPGKVGVPSPIKHIFYIIKENRTYDQVLGDMSEGNGSPDLCLFGEKISPNHHALAREFVLLDNFYVNGEVSADGHNWSLGAYATDYLEKTWPTNYGGRGGSYDAEGNREIANNKNGFLWDNCSRQGVSFRSYGEFVDNNKANIPVLRNHFCKRFTSWDQAVRDTVRFYQWKHDFDSLLAADALPQLNTLRFINDHTEGLRLGRPTPFAHVADNDLAIGLFVDYLSHSPVWKESLVIMVEDDAQNGPDHVDAHRSVALIAGGFVKKGFVDHTPYTTTSLLRTIELILGLPPMSQYDAAATPLWRCLDNTPGHEPYSVKPILVDLNEKNMAENLWQKKSEKFDFTAEDKVNDTEFNEVIWKAVKGIDSPCPPAVRSAFFAAAEEDE
jgi:YVTN family beta-propeller protein